MTQKTAVSKNKVTLKRIEAIDRCLMHAYFTKYLPYAIYHSLIKIKYKMPTIHTYGNEDRYFNQIANPRL